MDLSSLVPVDNNTPSPLADSHIGLEARTQAGDHLDLKVWLRLLACSNQIEQQIRQRLRANFGTTQKSGVPDEELYQVFNMGIGMVAIVAAEKADAVLKFIKAQKHKAWLIGEVVKGKAEARVV